MRWRLATLLALTTACSDGIEPAQPLKNSCVQDFECNERDTCDEDLGICVRSVVEVAAQYPFALQIDPASSTLVERLTLDPRPLTGPVLLADVTVPNALKVTGKVLYEDKPREAELVFRVPGQDVNLRVPVTAKTLPTPPGSRNTQTYTVRLEPNTDYEVEVYPLGTDSWELPPQRFPLRTGTSDLTFDFVYGERVPFRGYLRDENNLPVIERKLRLRDDKTGSTVSSLGNASDAGTFTVWTTRPVIDQLARHELQIEIAPEDGAFRTTIAVGGSQLSLDGGVTLPVIPERVLFEARVEASPREGVENADVTFRSSFPLPDGGQVNGRDWCRTRASMDAGISCGTETTVPLGPESTISAALLPGDYDLFIQPRNRDSRDPQLVRTKTEKIRIETKPDGGAQTGSFFELPPAKTFGGTTMSPLGQPMPFVSVTAQALGFTAGIGEVAYYNRTANTLSDRRGRFRLAVDLGYYDLIGRPPEGSGFAWTVSPNRVVKEDFDTAEPLPLEPGAPVIARGRLTTINGTPVVQARVDAYAMVAGAQGMRPIRIAQTISDDAGIFVLQLPAELGTTGGEASESVDMDMDAGVGLDAGE